MNPLIYIPGNPLKTDQALKDLGLGPMLDEQVCPMWQDVFSGTPDDGRGRLVWFDCPHNPSTSSPKAINLQAQVWREAAKCGELDRGRFWVGWEKERPPTPLDLQRSNTTPGENVTLLDGNNWEIAVYSFVPHRRGIDLETGLEVRKPQTPYLSFVEKCRIFEEQFRNEEDEAIRIEGDTITMPGDFAFCAEAMALNYRVVPDLIDGLELIGDEELFHIVTAAVGIQTMAAIQREKKTSQHQLTRDGAELSCGPRV